MQARRAISICFVLLFGSLGVYLAYTFSEKEKIDKATFYLKFGLIAGGMVASLLCALCNCLQSKKIYSEVEARQQSGSNSDERRESNVDGRHDSDSNNRRRDSDSNNRRRDSDSNNRRRDSDSNRRRDSDSLSLPRRRNMTAETMETLVDEEIIDSETGESKSGSSAVDDWRFEDQIPSTSAGIRPQQLRPGSAVEGESSSSAGIWPLRSRPGSVAEGRSSSSSSARIFSRPGSVAEGRSSSSSSAGIFQSRSGFAVEDLPFEDDIPSTSAGGPLQSQPSSSSGQTSFNFDDTSSRNISSHSSERITEF